MTTTTIHKTIGGGRGGMILSREEYGKKIDSAVFPGQQGGPLEHIIAGKAVALRIAASDAFRERQQRTLDGARAVALGAAVGRRGRERADRRHRRAPGPVRPARVRARRQAGRGSPARDRDHRQPQRGPVRPAAAGRVLRAADRVAGPGDPGAAGRGLRRGGQDHRRGADRRGLRGSAGASSPSGSRRSRIATRCMRSWALRLLLSDARFWAAAGRGRLVAGRERGGRSVERLAWEGGELGAPGGSYLYGGR